MILTYDGIEWYALYPKWRFRKIPWHAVLDVRRGFFGLGGQIVLVVERGRYESWVWGNPQGDQRLDIEIWPTALVGGDGVLEAIKEWLRRSDQEGGVGVADERGA